MQQTTSLTNCFGFASQKHGEPPAKAAVAAGGAGANLIQVTLKSMAADSSHKAPVARKLPGSMTVANVKRMCQQLFGLDMSKQKLFCQAPGVKDVWEGLLSRTQNLSRTSTVVSLASCPRRAFSNNFG
jgi:hypothetical protein